MGCWRYVLRRSLLRLCVLISVFKGVPTTICTERASLDNFNHVIKMCEDLSLTTRMRVLIDTYDTGAPDVHSCRCTATYSSGVPTDVTVTAYPNTAPPDANCMSTLKVTSTKTSNNFSEYSCIAISHYVVGNFATSSDIITLTLSRSNGNSPWTSGHCIYISTGNFDSQNPTTFAVRCYPAEKSQTMTITTTSTTTPPSLPPTTTTPPPSLPPTTTTLISTVKPSTLSPTSSTDTTKVETSTAVIDTTISSNEELGFEIIVGAVAGGVVLIIIIIIIVVVRRLALSKGANHSEHVLTPSATDQYDSLELSSVERPNTYAEISTPHVYANTYAEISTLHVYANTDTAIQPNSVSIPHVYANTDMQSKNVSTPHVYANTAVYR